MILLFVGLFDPQQIAQFKRTKQFTKQDFELLEFILAEFSTVIVTPNILTEVNSLSNQLAEKIKLGGYFDVFAQGITVLDEKHFPSIDLSKMSEFKLFGLTDVGILALGRSGHLILTDDFRLSKYLGGQNIDVLNFNHLRSYLLD